MKRIIYIIIGITACLTSYAAGLGSVKALPQDSVTICRLLSEAKKQPASTCMPLFFAQKFVGIPYVAHTLEGDAQERLVVNTRQLDCTTLVETVTALTLCAQRKDYSWQAYQQALVGLRYRGGVVSEVQAPNPPFAAVQTVKVNYMSTHPKSYQTLKEHPEYVSAIAKQERLVSGAKYRYIPKKLVGKRQMLRKAIKDGDIIAITCNKAGLDIAHLGFAVWRNDGLHLLNASQLHHKVVLEPMTLYQYLKKHPSHTGIRIIRITK